MKRSFLWIAFALLLIALIAVLILRPRGDEAVPERIATEEAVPAAREEAPRHPVPDAQASAEKPLPPLDDSDQTLREELPSLFEEPEAKGRILADQLIRRIVVTIDNLDRRTLPAPYLPLKRPEGPFRVEEKGEALTIAPENARRYAPYVRLAQSVETETLVSVYVRLYPLFQKAYEELGYPEGYFNDRLVEILDHLLQTPEVREPVRLERPNVLYLFADPALERLSAGQKLLLRAGAQNAAALKEKLKELRQALAELPRAE